MIRNLLSTLSSDDTQNPLKGMILMVVAMLIIPTLDVFAKLLTDQISAGQIAWFRFVLQTLLITPFILYFRLYHIPKGTVILQAMRGIMLAGATVLFFAALIKLSIAQAIAIFFVEPMILTILSAVFLGEVIRIRRILAIIAGFIGALIIIRPTFLAVGITALYPLGAALCFAIYVIITRQLKNVSPLQMQWMVGISATLFMSLAVMIGHHTGWSMLIPGTPEGIAVLWVGCFGVIATIGHLILVVAVKHAPASLLAPFQYIEIISATIFGYWIFGDVLDQPTIIGVSIIIASGIYMFHREALTKNND